MRRIEHGTGGTVTAGVVRAGSRLWMEMVVHPAVLRAMPWYRGGTGVTTMVLPYGGGQMDIARAGLDAPYRLLARVSNRLDKLPPVQLRIPLLDGMAAEERAPEPVAYEVCGTVLTLTLPAWARRHAPTNATVAA